MLCTAGLKCCVPYHTKKKGRCRRTFIRWELPICGTAGVVPTNPIVGRGRHFRGTGKFQDKKWWTAVHRSSPGGGGGVHRTRSPKKMRSEQECPFGTQ